jgi:sulfur-oxidizing protein SoxY
MTVMSDGDLLFKMDGTFSISTNPNYRFTFGKGEANDLDVVIVDTDGRVFKGQTQAKGS